MKKQDRIFLDKHCIPVPFTTKRSYAPDAYCTIRTGSLCAFQTRKIHIYPFLGENLSRQTSPTLRPPHTPNGNILRRAAEPGLRPDGRPKSPILPIHILTARIRARDTLTSIIRLWWLIVRGWLRRLQRLQLGLWQRRGGIRAHGRAGRSKDRMARGV